MDNLKKFATEADYSAATLNYPAVSWVVSGDTVHFDKEAPTPTSYEKVIWYSPCEALGTCVLYNEVGGDVPSIQGITIKSLDTSSSSGVIKWSVEVNPLQSSLEDFGGTSGDYFIEYEISGNTLGDCFATTLGDGGACWDSELLIPSGITSMTSFPSNTFMSIVLESATPPTFAGGSSVVISLNEEGGGIYVPDAAVNTYKAASGWSSYSEQIFPISDYSGKLPV